MEALEHLLRRAERHEVECFWKRSCVLWTTQGIWLPRAACPHIILSGDANAGVELQDVLLLSALGCCLVCLHILVLEWECSLYFFCNGIYKFSRKIIGVHSPLNLRRLGHPYPTGDILCCWRSCHFLGVISIANKEILKGTQKKAFQNLKDNV